jgi:hypothetical protein
MNPGPYRAVTRFTDPADFAFLLADLPGDVDGICEIASRQTMHHNLRAYYGVPVSHWTGLVRVWPPVMRDVLQALSRLPPGRLTTSRAPEQRILSACVLESHLLACLLRHAGIPVRIRAGYFQHVRSSDEHVVDFWASLAHGNVETGCRLPAGYFEYAHQAWRRLRSGSGVDPRQHAEDPQDGWSHIRSQLLSDFYSLLRHDVAGAGDPASASWQFLKGLTYAAAAAPELDHLDQLAGLLARDAALPELTAFYWRSRLRLAEAEADPCCAVYRP